MSNLITPYCKYTTNFELFSLLQISTNLTEICFADMICQPFLNDKTPFDSDKEKSWYPILVFTLYTMYTIGYQKFMVIISITWKLQKSLCMYLFSCIFTLMKKQITANRIITFEWQRDGFCVGSFLYKNMIDRAFLKK